MRSGVGRREFLHALALGLGASAVATLRPRYGGAATPAPDPLGRARAILRSVILTHAKTKDDPLLLMHGIRAMGKGFSVGGVPAVDYLCSQCLEEEVVNGKAYLRMPIAYEGHTNAFLSEAILDAGVGSDYAFVRNGREHTIGDLVAGAKALFAFEPASFDRNDLAWSLTAFAHSTAPRQDRWVNAYGAAIRFADVIEFGQATLERATSRLQAAMRRGERTTDTTTEVDGIRNFACAGTHLIYGLASCLQFGHTQHGLPERMQRQFDLLVWRLDADSVLIDRYFEQAGGRDPEHIVRLYRWEARLKFLGHAVEVISYARQCHLFDPTSAQQAAIGRAHQELASVVEAIGRAGVGAFGGDEELLRTLVSDACHAYRGLAMSSG
jgi:hypothetical protein